MGEMKIEHVLLFLVGAFLVYHMMKGCGCNVEGITAPKTCSDCNLLTGRCLMPNGVCSHTLGGGRCNKKGGTWCPDHVDTIPGQTGPESTYDPKKCSDCTNPFHPCLINGMCSAAGSAESCNDQGGTWCPDHVDTIPGQTGPPATSVTRPATEYITCIRKVDQAHRDGRIDSAQYVHDVGQCAIDYGR